MHQSTSSHADTTWKDIVRDDNSTYHVAAYDPDTGELVDQGEPDDGVHLLPMGYGRGLY